MRAEHARLVHGIERLDLSGVQGEDEPEEKLNFQNNAKEEDSLRTDVRLSLFDADHFIGFKNARLILL